MNMTTWRPRQSIRTIAIAVIQRESKLLLMEVRGDNGKIKGWRPLGGEIEFGETATEAVARELKEETGLTAKVGKQIGVLENIYQHEGHTGHEIVFVFECQIPDSSLRGKDVLHFQDGAVDNTAKWINVNYIKENIDLLYPTKLSETLKLIPEVI